VALVGEADVGATREVVRSVEARIDAAASTRVRRTVPHQPPNLAVVARGREAPAWTTDNLA